VAFGLLYALAQTLSAPHTELPRVARTALAAAGAHDHAAQLRVLGASVFVLMLSKSAAAIVVARWQARVQNLAESRLSIALFREYMEQDFLYHVSRNSASLIRNLTGSIGFVTGAVVGSLVSLATEGLVLLGTLAIVAVAEPYLALGVALYAGIVLTGFVTVLGPTTHRAGAQDQERTARTIQLMQEGFAGIKSVHAFRVQGAVQEQYAAQRNSLAESRTTLAFVQRLPQYYLEICLVLGGALAAAVLLATVGTARTAALLALLVIAALRVLPSVGRILGALSGIRTGGPAVQLLLHERSSLPQGEEGARPAGPVPSRPPGSGAGRLVLRGVRFRYPGTPTDALAGIDLEVEPGAFIGIVGPSGAGKTTLVDVILGLLQPTGGSVEVDGTSLSAGESQWSSRVGYVPQDTYLLDSTFRENVLFHRVGTDEEVWAALEGARLADAARSLTEGLDTPIAERGLRLSGGQRQRLGIARALFGHPAVLILDEATSALDGATEAEVADTLNALRGRVTLIVVAHRLSTLRNCDRLVLVEAGHVRAQGSLEELALASPSFSTSLRHAELPFRGRVEHETRE